MEEENKMNNESKSDSNAQTEEEREALLQNEWVFRGSQINILSGEENVLGRGSFGEVRVAEWRGIRIAAKRLHALSLLTDSDGADGSAQAQRDFLKEMQLLSRLRHPNLLLFLGVCFEPANLASCMILTELLPYSIYDLLEKQKLRLTFSEILDITHDVIGGLAYLHNHQPTIIHRDISSKNILYDGRVAKIADLGQAKVFGGANSNSRNTQTAMPGAMVYSAPEVLTGKYSARIDIFSFGVLFAQLVTGQYPRIEQRQQQVDAAAARFPPLRNLLHRCLSLHPDMRPTASEIHRLISSFKEDLRVYTLPQHGAGIVATRWFQNEFKDVKRDAENRALVMEKRLEAELGRWRTEADARDELAKKLLGTETVLQETLEALKMEKNVVGEHKRMVAESEESKKETEEELDKVYASLKESQKNIEDLQHELAVERRRVESAQRLKECAEQNEQRAVRAAEKALADQEMAEKVANEARKEAQNESQKNKESEERIQQLLRRWEKEKLERLTLKAQYLERQKEMQKLKDLHEEALQGLEMYQTRLSEYSSMEVGEQMQRRLFDAEQDRNKAQEKANEMSQKMLELEGSILEFQSKVQELSDTLQKSEQQEEEMRKKAADLEKSKEDWETKGTAAVKIRDKLESKIQKEKEKYQLSMEENKRLQKELDSIKTEAPWLFQRSGSAKKDHRSWDLSSQGSLEEVPPLKEPKQAIATAKEEGTESVISLLKQHLNDPNLQWRGVKLLRELAYQGDEQRAEIGAVGGVEVVTLAMLNHTDHQALQNNGVRCLSNLAFGNDTNRIEIGLRNGIKAILQAMKGFPHDSSIQGQGCTALTNLSHNCERNRVLIFTEEGVDVILDAMQAFPGDPKVQRQACWALLTLAGSDDGCARIADRGGVGAIVAAMTNCREDASVQHFGCWALANIAWGREDVQTYIRKEGALEVVKAAVSRFPSHRGVVEKAQLAIEQLKPQL